LIVLGLRLEGLGVNAPEQTLLPGVAVEPREIFLRHPAHLMALGFGAGLCPIAPGTAGTLWAWASFVVLDWLMPSSMWFWILAVGVVVGIWACEKTGRALGQSDHGAMVWDEVMAFWLVLVCLPHPADPNHFATSQGLSVWLLQAVAFGLFRFFDIMKPPPIKWVDQHCKGGWGVMADDLVAAAFTLLAVALLLRLWPWLA
jgi:phosphatidylglycerophosphatase A